MVLSFSLKADYFYPRPPRGGRPASVAPMLLAMAYFYPRPPRGGRRIEFQKLTNKRKFLSTPSARRATPHLNQECRDEKFLSTPSARRATVIVGGGQRVDVISIHALREEGDAEAMQLWIKKNLFLSTPSARRATHSASASVLRNLFLSTPSARRATRRRSSRRPSPRYFYPRPPRGGRPARRRI